MFWGSLSSPAKIFLNSLVVLSLKVDISIYKVSSFKNLLVTEGTCITSLVISKSKYSLFLNTTRLTLVPSSPLTFAATVSVSIPSADLPSISIIISPGNSPAFSAGESVNILIPFMRLVSLSNPSTIPIPA